MGLRRALCSWAALPAHTQLSRTLFQSGVNAQHGPLILTPSVPSPPWADVKHLWMANHRWILTGTPINAAGALCALSQLAEHHQAVQLQAARKAPRAALAACTKRLHSVSALVHSTYPPHPTYPSIHLAPTPPPHHHHTHMHAPTHPQKPPHPLRPTHTKTHILPPPAVDTIGPSLDFLRLGGGYTDAYRHLPPLMAHVLQVDGHAFVDCGRVWIVARDLCVACVCTCVCVCRWDGCAAVRTETQPVALEKQRRPVGCRRPARPAGVGSQVAWTHTRAHPRTSATTTTISPTQPAMLRCATLRCAQGAMVRYTKDGVIGGQRNLELPGVTFRRVEVGGGVCFWMGVVGGHLPLGGGG